MESETSKGQPAAPGLADDNASNLGYTPAPSHFGATGYQQQDSTRGRDESSEVPGSGGLFSAAIRAGQPERCDVCGIMHAPADLNKCPECRGNFCVRCSPGAGACPNCDGPAFRRGRDDQRAPIGQRTGGIGVSRGENTRGMEKCEKITIKDEPEANAIQMWIVDVATTARMAYGFDSNYAYAMVAGVMSHDERTLDEPLRYNHLENALFVGLKGAIKTVALHSDVRVRMMDGKPLTALRSMKIMIEYFRVPEENEDMLHANALASVRLNNSPHIEEGQALHKFFSKWEMQYANYTSIATRSQTDAALANNLILMVEDLRILSHDVEAWRSMKASERNIKWLKEKIRYRIKIWRAEKNCAKAATAAFETAVVPGYSALPAEGKGSGAYRTTPNRTSQVGRGRERSSSPAAGQGRGLSISADVRKKIGTPDDLTTLERAVGHSQWKPQGPRRSQCKRKC